MRSRSHTRFRHRISTSIHPSCAYQANGKFSNPPPNPSSLSGVVSSVSIPYASKQQSGAGTKIKHMPLPLSPSLSLPRPSLAPSFPLHLPRRLQRAPAPPIIVCKKALAFFSLDVSSGQQRRCLQASAAGFLPQQANVTKMPSPSPSPSPSSVAAVDGHATLQDSHLPPGSELLDSAAGDPTSPLPPSPAIPPLPLRREFQMYRSPPSLLSISSLLSSPFLYPSSSSPAPPSSVVACVRLPLPLLSPSLSPFLASLGGHKY